MASADRARFDRESQRHAAAALVLVEAPDRDLIQLTNVGVHSASAVTLTYPGLRFQTLMEDDDAGLSVAPGEVLELMPLIDWDHPRNRHERDHRRNGHMGVPHFPLYLGWTDGNGIHNEQRRVKRRSSLPDLTQ